MPHPAFLAAGFLTLAPFLVFAQSTRYAYVPVALESIWANWTGDGKNASEIFLPADVIAAGPDGSIYARLAPVGCVIRISPAGKVTVVFRYGPTAFRNGGPALGTMLTPRAIAVDPDGVLYFSDQTRNRIFRVESDATLTLVAGTGTRGFSGDAGPATSAQIGGVLHMAFDASGTLYLCDTANGRVRAVDRSGVIRTVAGNGQAGNTVSGAQAVGTPLSNPAGVGVDGAGNLYILRLSTTQLGMGIWKVDRATGTIRPWAGGGTDASWPAVGMTATQANLEGLTSLAVETDGTLYLTWVNWWNYGMESQARLLRVSPAGVLQIVAGTGPAGYSAASGPARQALLANPKSVATDRRGSIYFVDHLMLRKVDSQGLISTISGTPAGPPMGEDGPMSAAQIAEYTTVAQSPDGAVYFAETFTSTVWKIDAAGILRRVAGTGVPGLGGDPGSARNSMLRTPAALCFDRAGSLFVLDPDNRRVYRVSSNGAISTVVGGGTDTRIDDPADPVAGTRISTTDPWRCTVDPQGNLVYTDTGHMGLYRLDSAGMVKRFVGVGGHTKGFSGDGGPATAARLSDPTGLGYDSKGNLYIADTNNNRVRIVNAAGVISTFAGTGTAGFSGDGGAAVAAQLNQPSEIAVDAQDNVFVLEWAGRRVRRITPTGRIDTIAGGGTSLLTSGMEATSAPILTSWYMGLATGTQGALLMADGNGLIKLEPGQIFSNWVAHGASFQIGAVSPGQIVTYWGLEMGPKQMTQAAYDAAGQLATSVAGAKIFFDGIPAPLVYVSEGQSSAIVPYGVTGSTTKMQAEYNGKRTNIITLPVAPTLPGIFTYAAGTGQGVIVNTDGTFNRDSNAIPRGGWIVFFVTGQGLTSPGTADGQLPVSPNFPAPSAPVRIFFGDVEAPASDTWTGLIFQGVLQVNVKVPEGVTPGVAVGLRIRIGDQESPAGVTVAVK